MKCPICNTENDPQATTCQQCGFALGSDQFEWPKPPEVEIPKLDDLFDWPEPASIEMPTLMVEPFAPQEAPVAPPAEPLAPSLPEPPPGEPSADDELAQSHIARGDYALRQGSIDQARWEFEQARDVADDEEIVRLAQSSLAKLYPPPPAVRTRPTPQPSRPAPQPPRPAPSRPSPVPASMAASTMQLGLILAVVNAIVTGLGAICCVGVLAGFPLGLLAGWMVGHEAKKGGRTLSSKEAQKMGAIVGLGGWAGGAFALFVFLSARAGMETDPFILTLLISILPGLVYTSLVAAASNWGWQISQRTD
ncbi:MAG: zinc ribbon domain-containing protein [Anaerolineae bacterium]|nr:zinc ribbon domain-containing protein [Anaerolineae bacterium]